MLHNVTKGVFVATDLDYYALIEKDVDDIDYLECQETIKTLEMVGNDKVKVNPGFNVFDLSTTYKKKIESVTQPGLIIAIGLNFNTNNGDTSVAQKKIYGGCMAEFNGNAIKSMMEEFPGTPIVLITTGNYVLVNESGVHFPHLTRLNVKMANGDGCKLTSVRYGESDPDMRFYNEDHSATCVSIDFNQMRNYVDVYDGTFDVWAITSVIINAGQNVLVVASNRFDNAVKLSKYSFAEKGRRVNGWHMPTTSRTSRLWTSC